MRRIIFALLLCLTVLTASAQQVLCSNADRNRVIQLLQEAARKPRTTNWMMHFAKVFYGVPYVGGTLDKDTEERLIVNLTELDCTTYVETVLALAICAKNGETTFDDYCRHLRDVRYIGGKVDYVKRQHYFTVWIDDNVAQNIVSNISHNPPFSALQTVHVDYMTKHVSLYKMLSQHKEWLPGISSMERSVEGKQYRYIPKSALKPSNNALLKQYIHDGDIIAIVTKKQGLDISHIGMASWHKDGLHLINASSIKHKVLDDPSLLYDYLKRSDSNLGIRVLRMR